MEYIYVELTYIEENYRYDWKYCEVAWGRKKYFRICLVDDRFEKRQIIDFTMKSE